MARRVVAANTPRVNFKRWKDHENESKHSPRVSDCAQHRTCWSPLPADDTRAVNRDDRDRQFGHGFEWDKTTTTTASSTPSRSSSGPDGFIGQEVGRQAANGPVVPATPSPRLEIATQDAEENAAERLTGEPVKDRGGAPWGDIRDILLHRETGGIEWVVVATGGILGAGETLRLVPYSKLQWEGGDRFRADLAGKDVRRLPTISGIA